MPDALVERDDHLLTITLNRPERMNALSGAMLVRMYDAFVEASRNDDIRCILLTGKHLTERDALAIGLIGHVVPDGQALAKGREIAQVICANGPLAVEAILRTLHETDGMTEAEALAHEFDYGWKVFQSEDLREGPRAFKEKRTPNFQRC